MFVRSVDESAGSAPAPVTQQSKKAMIRNKFALVELWGRRITFGHFLWFETGFLKTDSSAQAARDLLWIDQWRLRQLQVDHEI